MISEAQVTQICEELLKESEPFLVEVKVKPGNRIGIRIDADKGVNIEHCRSLHRGLEEKLDREKEDFELEVSSAGLDEPFLVKRQYFKNVGRQIEVLLSSGKKRTGVLSSADENGIVVTEKPKWKNDPLKEHRIEYTEIKQTRKIITFK